MRGVYSPNSISLPLLVVSTHNDLPQATLLNGPRGSK